LFVRRDDVYEQALSEIRRGHKRTHWMWFVFPQLDGLGSSPTAKLYAIKSAGEARAYLAHPVLGPRLQECVQALLVLEGESASEIFGFPDDLKLRRARRSSERFRLPVRSSSGSSRSTSRTARSGHAAASEARAR
jgi:uncharacterized protein (DUF1810 family)